jgi:hypothetical protein
MSDKIRIGHNGIFRVENFCEAQQSWLPSGRVVAACEECGNFLIDDGQKLVCLPLELPAWPSVTIRHRPPLYWHVFEN